MASIKRAILKAIIYADLFDFPLTEDECRIFSVGVKIPSDGIVRRELSMLPEIEYSDGYYFLKGRKSLVSLRKKRKECSMQKMEIARALSVYLSFIPTIQFIGISGGVGAGNADEDDDIDFFIISGADTLWTTRVLTLLVLHLMGRRRAKDTRFVSDLACVNMFMDEGDLSLPHSMRSIYSAYEVLNMRPVFSRGKVYEAFLKKNEWVFSYLPNAKRKVDGYTYKESHRTNMRVSRFFALNPVVQLSKFLQQMYMGRRRKESLISDSMLGFFPQGFHASTLKKYEERLGQYGIYEL